MRVDQLMDKWCYGASLKAGGSKYRWKVEIVGTLTQVHFLDLDPRKRAIDPNFLCHKISITPGMWLVCQKKRRLGDEKR
ncbi:hypothetical protein CR513_39379, partial [Mucuna pruriens]